MTLTAVGMHPWRRFTGLRPTDRRMVILLALGLTEREVAENMGVTHAAMVSHTRRIRRLLGVPSKTTLIAKAIDDYYINALPMHGPMVLVGRDREILEGLREGHTSEQISRTIETTPRGVKIRIERMLNRNGAHNQAHLMALYCSQEFYGAEHLERLQAERHNWDNIA